MTPRIAGLSTPQPRPPSQKRNWLAPDVGRASLSCYRVVGLRRLVTENDLPGRRIENHSILPLVLEIEHVLD